MADNYIQRSHRQDDSQLGNDDPLMELSRIMGTPDEESSAGSNDDLALDLERELMGGFDEQAVPQSAGALPDDQQAVDDDRFAVQEFQDSIERELGMSEPSVIAAAVAAYEEPDYADYEPDTSYADGETGEGVTPQTSVEAVASPYEEGAAVAAPPVSLEDELETLLAGSAQPVVHRSANASWGYGSQAQVAGRTEPAPVISRMTSYQTPAAPEPDLEQVQPAAEAEISQAAPVQEPVIYDATEEQAQHSEHEDFDAEELMAAFDDFDVHATVNDEVEEEAAVEQEAAAESSEPVFPRYHSVVQPEATVREPISVPVASPIASAPRLPEVHDLSDYADELDRAAASLDAPDVDTVAVTENRVEYTEALDLPAVHYEDDAPANNGLGELESEFAEVFGSIEAEDPRTGYAAHEETPKSETEQDQYADIFADVFGNQAEQGPHSPSSYAAAAAGAAAVGMAGVAAAKSRAQAYQHGPEEDSDFAYDPQRDEVDIAATPYGQQDGKRQRSSFFVPGVAAAVVLVAVAGAVAYKWTSGSGGEPVVITADKTPIKVQPETTGTAVVPNQDKAVYDKGATIAPEAPKQDQLVTTREDPVDLAADEDEDMPATDKVEERVDPAIEDVASSEPPAQRNGAIAPRKVQTMVVKPDGTMVAAIPQEGEALSTGPAVAPVDRPEAPASAASDALAPVASNAPAPAADTIPLPDESADDAIGSLVQGNDLPAPPQAAEAPAPAPVAAKPAAETPKPAAGNLPAKPVETKKITQETVATAPKNIPVVESRPAEQPLDIVDRVPPKNAAGQQVASTAPAAGSYMIQIASQPNVEGAQKTYATLSQRYASVIGGRGVDIKQAEIAGKGTFFRVRIPAGSKADAVALCTKYKSAGGSCFVTQ